MIDDTEGKLSAALAAIPKGDSVAVVAMYDLDGSGQLHGAVRFGRVWTLGASFGRTKDKDLTGQVVVKVSF